jgi:hypothetical protein
MERCARVWLGVLGAALVAPASGAQNAPATPPLPALIAVTINPESRVKAVRIPASEGGVKTAVLVQGEWTAFRVRVRNEARVTPRLRVAGPNLPAVPGDREQWLDARLEPDTPLKGVPEEWRILRLRSRDAGMREARLVFDVGQGTQDLGFRSEVSLLFRCRPRTP